MEGWKASGESGSVVGQMRVKLTMCWCSAIPAAEPMPPRITSSGCDAAGGNSLIFGLRSTVLFEWWKLRPPPLLLLLPPSLMLPLLMLPPPPLLLMPPPLLLMLPPPLAFSWLFRACARGLGLGRPAWCRVRSS